MRKINKKFIITFLGVLLLSIICFTGVTMMFADERNGAGLFATATDANISDTLQSNVKGAATPTTTPSSIIDWIIDFSNSTDPDIDKIYHIVEIYSGTSPSDLSTMVGQDGKFEKLVLDGHKSEGFTPDFKPGNIDYKSYSNGESDTTLITAIEGADLVYFSEDPDAEWDENNDITEQVLQALVKYAVTDGKPFIIDSHNLTQQIKILSQKYVKDVVANYYAKEGTIYNTFSWNNTKSIEEVMNTANVSAVYKALDGDAMQAGSSTNPDFGWNKVTYTEVKTKDDPSTTDKDETETEEHTEYIGRILTIYSSAVSNDLTLTDKISACCSSDYSFTFTDAETTGTATKDKTVAAKGTFTADGTVKVLDEDSDFYKFAYYGRNARPDALKFEKIDMSDTTDFTSLETIDFTQYDFVIFEESTKDVDISKKDADGNPIIYNRLAELMTSGVHVFYDSNISPDSSSHSQSELKANGVKQLYDRVAYTANDTPRYSHVLVTARDRMNNIYSKAETASSVKDIADIINSGAFRSIGKSSTDSATDKYRVLEIEPCYPIDDTLAQALYKAKDLSNQYGVNFIKASGRSNVIGNGKQYSDRVYYLKTDQVNNDKTSDEISFGTTDSLTTILENTTLLNSFMTQDKISGVTEYYKWAVSKAKICHATGKKWTDVEVVHMSSAEFASSRKTLLDTYDAIYIGGDNSAIKAENKWYTNSKGNYYTMYFHNGDIFDYDNSLSNKDGGTYGVLSGNDLTYNKMDELIKYAKNGMPVILDRSVCNAYVGAHEQDDAQHLMDPDSNMYNFIYSVTDWKNSTIESKYNNVLLNFDPGYTYKVVNNGEYGNTYGGYATVFLGQDQPTDAFKAPTYENNKVGEDKLKDVLKANERPRFVITVCPRTYSDMPKKNNSTWIDPDEIKNEGLVWKIQGENSNATYNLYIDDNSDGKFDKTEELFGTKNGKNVTITFKPNSDYYGVVYWKIEAVVGNLSSSTTGCCKIKRTTQSKMYVNLLQVMPVAGADKYSTSETKNVSLRTLFFCTECQFAKDILRPAAYTRTGIITEGVMGGQNTLGGGAPGWYNESTTDIEACLKKIDSSYVYRGSKLGSHTHDFGLVEYKSDLKLGSITGADNIESNLFDIIRDDYDVDETIMFTDDFQNKVGAVNSLYSGLSSTAITNKKKGYEQKYTKYKAYYDGIKALLNGKVEGYNKTYVSVSGTNATPNWTDLNADFSYAGKTFTEFMSEIGITQAQLTNYASASYKMDDILENRLNEFEFGQGMDAFDDVIQNALTDEDIPRDMRKYHHVFSLTAKQTDNNQIPDDFLDQYVYYRDAKIIENCLFDLLQENLWNSSYDEDSKTVDLDNIYDCIAIGAADHFGGAENPYSDLNDTACDALEKYIKADGNLILFHDTLTADQNATEVMTKRLGSLFGMNARHMSVGKIKTAENKEIELTVNGTGVPGKISLPSTTQKRQMVIQQTAGDIVATDNSVQFSVGDSLSSRITGLSNDDKGYDITVKKTQGEVGVFNVKLYSGLTWDNKANIEVGELSFDASVTSVKAELWFTWGNPTSGVHNVVTSGNNTGSHNIALTIDVLKEDGNTHDTTAMNYDDLYLVMGDDIDHPIKLTDNAAYQLASTNANSTVTKDLYSLVGTPAKKAGSFSGAKGLQQFDVKFVDASNNVLSGERVDFTVNGNPGSAVSGDDGIATFYRENYTVTGFNILSDTTENVDTTSHPDGFVDDQTLEITVQDVNGNPMTGISVQANVSATSSLTYPTGTDGKVSFVYKNYTEQVDTSTRTYTVDSGYSADTYKISNINGTNNSGISLSPYMLSMRGIYQTFGVGNFGNVNQYIMYRYVEMSSQLQEVGLNNTRIGSQHMMNNIYKADNAPAYPTDYCERNNVGIITMYPFTIPPRIHVGVTAPGSYALDVEDDNLVVYYSMVGGTEGTGSSLFAADPMDGQNNYFLYQYGSITYTGAGHGLLTGFGRQNNDERKLFINCIVNAGKKSMRGPTLTLHDLDTTLDKVQANDANKIIKECNYEDCDYYTEIEDLEDFKGFDFLPHIPTGNKLQNVKVYYDVNHTDDYDDDGAYSCDADDVEILKWDRDKNSSDTSVGENILKAIKQSTTENRSVLMDSYFDVKKNKDYAYIVVEIEDVRKQKAHAVLRIQFKESLIDLN